MANQQEISHGAAETAVADVMSFIFYPIALLRPSVRWLSVWQERAPAPVLGRPWMRQVSIGRQRPGSLCLASEALAALGRWPLERFATPIDWNREGAFYVLGQA
jgi:hypothetical protein